MLNSGIYTDQLKLLNVVPLFKANGKSVLTKYRPIALLPSKSKKNVYILLEQLTNHFIEHKLLSPQLYGFRAQQSTELTALNLVDYLTYKLDNGNIKINNYIDLSKAFGKLIHGILLGEMNYYGVNGVTKNGFIITDFVLSSQPNLLL